jgi:signal transduction histidine kinase
VHADQVLLNLCINARDAMDGNGAVHVRLARTDLHGAVCASCRKRVAGAYVELAVRDTGPGIAPEVVERMFEPFFTTKSDGIGMGLAISRSIVEAHGGHIAAASNGGGGATVRLALPVSGSEVRDAI